MPIKIVITSDARADLHSIADHISQDNPEAAVRLSLKIVEKIKILYDFPLIGHPIAGNVRGISFQPYQIVYRTELSGDITVLRIWHSARGNVPLD